MKLIIKVTTVILLVLITGCNEEDKTVKTATAEAIVDTRLFKEQRDALKQSEQVVQATQDAAALQRQKIEQATQ